MTWRFRAVDDHKDIQKGVGSLKLYAGDIISSDNPLVLGPKTPIVNATISIAPEINMKTD